MAVSGDNRFLPKLLTFSRRLIFVSISVILGAVIFMSIENTGIEPEVKEQPRSCPVESLKARICRQLNITMSEAEYVSLIDSIGFHVSRRLNVTVNKTAFRTALQGSQESVQPPIIQRAEKWSFTSGIHFAWTVITTIGMYSGP